jgi:hypothetical protein
MALAGIGALRGIAGSIGIARRRERIRRDQDVLAAGYLGGYIAAGLALVDLVARYAA